MPVTLGFLLFAGPLGGIFSFGSLVAASQIALGLGVTLATGLLFRPKVPDAPKPEDGKYNLRQNVPSLTVVLGKVKKSSDYDALEEKNGEAHHVMVIAGHRINAFLAHYLHDEEATFGVDGFIVTPSHFDSKVEMYTRLGLDVETAYPRMIEQFPSIWTEDHRGDGLATVHMVVRDTGQEEHQKTFPQNMPAHSAEIEGALIYDPRNPSHDPDDKDTWEFSTNLPLLRLFHLTHPSGGKLTFDDIHLPDWINAANVADQQVLNKASNPENRYHGGMWYRYENDPVQIGRILDQAGEMVIYETSEGKVGVHAGEFVAPDIRITENDITSLVFDANRRKNSSVLAVRGKFTDPGKIYNTVDAAIYGDPYVGDNTERTKTVDNVAVQSHNHIQRLQKITFKRTNSPRITLTCHYEAAKQIPYRRFIKVHYPPKLDEAIIEIIGRPKLSLKSLTYEIEGIVVSEDLFDFDASVDEGDPPPDVDNISREDVPAPVDFDVEIQRESVAGGYDAAFGLASWGAQSESLITEVEWQPTAGGTIQSVRSSPGELTLRTAYLSDGSEYRFRGRNWSSGTPSEWTDYIILTAVANPEAPKDLSSFTLVGASPYYLGNAPFSIATQNDDNAGHVALYRVASGGVLDRENDRVAMLPVSKSSSTYNYTDGDSTVVNLLSNPGFSSDTVWSKGAGWTIASGVASKAPGTASNIFEALSLSGVNYRVAFEITLISAGNVRPRLTGGTIVNGTYKNSTGIHYQTLLGSGANTSYSLGADSLFNGDVDNAVIFQETLACAPQGDWDYYAEPINPSGIAGTLEGPLAVKII